MPQIFYFLFKVILCSGILFGYYHLFLRNKVYHAYNRYYLLCAVLLSLTVPFLQFDIYNSKDETQVQPIQILEVLNNSDAYVEEVISTGHTQNLVLSDLLLAGYVAVAFVFLVSLILLLFSVFSLIRGSKKITLDTIILINSDAKGTPFSFFRYLFWNNQIDINTETGKHILSHELAHIREKHSLDKLFINIVLIICWVNPFFWLMRKELHMIHEFIADRKAVGHHDTAVFAAMIIQTAYPSHNFLVTNHFFYSPIKRRLKMLSKYKSTRATYFTRILALPVLFFLIAAFTFKAKEISGANIEKEFIVVVDAGHGGQDGGAKGIDGTEEKTLNLALAKLVRDLNTNDKIKIILTRETDVYQSPKVKIDFANNLKADLFISIHVSSTLEKYFDITNGMEVLVAGDASNKLASAVIEAFQNNYGLKVKPNPIQRPASIWVLQKAACPAVLIEAGYLSHKKDREYLKSKAGKETFAGNLLTAIQKYLALASFNEKPSMPLAVANVLGLKPNHVGITNGEGDTIPKSAKDISDLKDRDVRIIENVDMIMNLENETYKLENALIVINDKIYDILSLQNKKITAKRALIYSKNNKKMLELYGKKAMQGAVIFKDAQIKNLPGGKYEVVIDRANQNLNIDASQRLNEQFVKVDGQKIRLNSNTIGIDTLNQPLYILDGKKISMTILKAIDPQSIESINVLKGVPAELLYGAEAKHGAVLIATKKISGIEVEKNKISPGGSGLEITLSGLSNSRIPLSRLKEIVKLQTNLPGYRIISATIYFVGAGFPNVMTSSLNGESLSGNPLFKRIQGGTTITIDNAVVEDETGKRSTLPGKAFTFYDTEVKQLHP